jgi:hypothetical protein
MSTAKYTSGLYEVYRKLQLKPFEEANINSGLKRKAHWLVVK